jgi:periplasmic divalent cation tolerance protein
MTEFIDIHWTSPSIDEARRVARQLVKERLVASAHITPWIESIYMLDNCLETTQESKITFKARATDYDQIVNIIKSNSSYQVPEILYTVIDGGNQEYIDWLLESTPPGFSKT